MIYDIKIGDELCINIHDIELFSFKQKVIITNISYDFYGCTNYSFNIKDINGNIVVRHMTYERLMKYLVYPPYIIQPNTGYRLHPETLLPIERHYSFKNIDLSGNPLKS